MSIAKKNLVYSLAEKILRAGLTFISLGVVARYLGPSEFGHLSFLLAVIVYFQLFSAFGLDHILVRELSLSEKTRNVFWESLSFKFITTLLALCGYGSYLIFGDRLDLYSVIFSIAIFMGVLDNSRIFLEAQNLHFKVARIELFYQIFSAILKIVIGLFSYGKLWIFLIFALDSVIPRLLLFFITGPFIFPRPPLKFDLKRYAKMGGHYFLTTILVIGYMKIDQLIVGKVMGLKSLGNYSAAVRLADSWYFVPVTISAVFFPLALKTKEGRYLQVIFDLCLWVSVIVIGGLFFIGEDLFSFMFGAKYVLSKSVLNIVFLSGLFMSLILSTAAWLNYHDHRNIMLARSLIGTLLNIVLNFIFIPPYGLFGVALATLFSYGVTFLLTFMAKDSKECWGYVINSLSPIKSFKRLQGVIKEK